MSEAKEPQKSLPEQKSSDQGKALCDAAMNGDLAAIQNLLQQGVSVDARNQQGESALNIAAANNKKDVATLLLQHGADVNDRGEGEGHETLLHLAADDGFPDIVELLSQWKADVNARDRWERTPLHLAAIKGHEEAAKVLLQREAEVNARDDKGETPLHKAAKYNAEGILTLLLQHRANVEVQNNFKITALNMAQHHSHAKSLLQQAHADLAAQKKTQHPAPDSSPTAAPVEVKQSRPPQEQGLVPAEADHQPSVAPKIPLPPSMAEPLLAAAPESSPAAAPVEAKQPQSFQEQNLIEAIKANNLPAVRHFLASADVDMMDAMDRNGRTPLLIAAKVGNAAIVREILAKGGVDINAQQAMSGATALHIAAAGGHEAMVELLLQHKANVQVRDAYDRTALHEAAIQSHNPVAELLIRHDVRIINARDHYGDTALHAAAAKNNTFLIDLLLKQGAKIDSYNNSDSTPLCLAARFNQGKAISLLLKHGANPQKVYAPPKMDGLASFSKIIQRVYSARTIKIEHRPLSCQNQPTAAEAKSPLVGSASFHSSPKPHVVTPPVPLLPIKSLSDSNEDAAAKINNGRRCTIS